MVAPDMVPPAVADIVPPPVRDPVPAKGAAGPRRRRPNWVFWVAIAGMLVVLAQMVVLRRPAVTASLLVRVAAPNGAAVPGGQVLVDNQVVGLPGQVLSVPPGAMTVSYANPGWHADPHTVRIAPNASLTVDLQARELPGRLTLTTTPPGATIAFAGRVRGKSPFTADLVPGSYDISVTLSGYVAKIVSLTMARGDPAVVNVDLTSAPVRRTDAPFDRGVMTKAAQLLAAPAWNADVLAMLFAGSEVQVQARVLGDPAWLQVRAGGRTGYVPAEGTVEPWDGWGQRNAAAGPLDTVTPDLRVLIGGRSFPLAGVQAPGQGVAATNAILQVNSSLLTALHGSDVRCVPHDVAAFQCRTASGQDIAELYVQYGAASVSDGALAGYAEAQRVAREQQRGMWAP